MLLFPLQTWFQAGYALILIGLLFAGSGSSMGTLAYVGVACFGLSTLFQLFTLPTEFDASRRAIRAIEPAESSHPMKFMAPKKCLPQRL